MTTANAFTKPAPRRFRLPDIPERHPDDMTSYDNLHRHGASPNLIQYLGDPDTTIVSAEHYVVPGPPYVAGESRYPDLLVAFDADPADYAASNGYVVSEQGKAPDFILEVASRRTASDDLAGKKDYYEGLGVGEYWLFDSAGEFYGFTLQGYLLEGVGYRAIDVHEIGPGVFQGYSAALDVNLRAEDGYLGWHDPATGEHIPTLQSQTARVAKAQSERDAEREARITEREARVTEQARADQEQVRADAAEAELAAERARARQLEDLIRRHQP